MPYGHLPPFYDDGHLFDAAGEFEHLFQVTLVRLDIFVRRVIAICRPGIVGIGSTRLPVDNNLFGHYPALLFCCGHAPNGQD